MNREEHYMVLKLSDIDKHLIQEDCARLFDLERKVACRRVEEGRPPLECIVVESDWPEYEATWQAIEKRVDHERYQ